MEKTNGAITTPFVYLISIAFETRCAFSFFGNVRCKMPLS